jgi:hypothetical protein
MVKAVFIVRDGMVAGSLMTAHGPFPSEEDAIAAAASFQPGSYTIYGGAAVGKKFTIAAPVISFAQD